MVIDTLPSWITQNVSLRKVSLTERNKNGLTFVDGHMSNGIYVELFDAI